MLRNKLVKSDGSIIDSSVILSCEFTEGVNSSTNLTVGDATASELVVEILSTSSIHYGDVLTYYTIEDGVETKIGVFTVDIPTVASKTSMRFSAYDNIVKTERNFSPFLRDHQSDFPMSIGSLAERACAYCGVTLASGVLPNSSVLVGPFYADGITCRQILMWVATIAGRYVVANADGDIEFKWYTERTDIVMRPDTNVGITVLDDGNGNVSITSGDLEVFDDGEGNVTLNSTKLVIQETDTGVALSASVVGIPYLLDSMSYERYKTEKIQRVQIKHSDDDVGIIYPPANDGACFEISGNMLLGTMDTEVVRDIANSLYTQLSSISYVPFSATVLKTMRIRAGDVVQVTDSHGDTFQTYVMEVSVTPGGTSITSTGDQTRESGAAVASQQYGNLTGKILAIKQSVDGLEVENKDLGGKLASLALSTEQFKTYVGETYVSEGELDKYKSEVSTQFTQTSSDFEMKFTSATEAIDNVNKDLQDKYKERTSYIRFVDGNIVLGKSDSNILLVLKNNRISFVQGSETGPEIAYISNNILYITEGEFLTQLRIGKFGFIPGANGNLSFKKVVG